MSRSESKVSPYPFRWPVQLHPRGGRVRLGLVLVGWIGVTACGTPVYHFRVPPELVSQSEPPQTLPPECSPLQGLAAGGGRVRAVAICSTTTRTSSRSGGRRPHYLYYRVRAADGTERSAFRHEQLRELFAPVEDARTAVALVQLVHGSLIEVDRDLTSAAEYYEWAPPDAR